MRIGGPCAFALYSQTFPCFGPPHVRPTWQLARPYSTHIGAPEGRFSLCFSETRVLCRISSQVRGRGLTRLYDNVFSARFDSRSE